MTTLSSPDSKRNSLKSFEVFSLFTNEKLKSLVNDSEKISMNAGEILFREGDTGDSMFVILSGEFSIISENTRVAQKGQGDYFGEMTLIEDKPRSATITATKNSQLLKISKEQFHLHFASNSQALMGILKTVSERARENLKFMGQGMKSLQTQKKLNTNLQNLINDTSNEIYIFRSSSFSLLSMNLRARDNLGYDKKEITCLTLFDLIDNLTKENFESLVKPLRLGKKDRISFKGVNRRKDGSKYSIEYTFKLQKSKTSSFLIGIAQDISILKNFEKKITRLNYYDSLTGLPNKNLILENLNSELIQTKGNDKSVTVLLIALDDFQTVNNSLGRAAGDNLLRAVAKRLQKWSSSKYPIAKLREIEFIIILPWINFESETAKTVSELHKLFQSPFSIAGQETHISISIGTSCYPTDGDDGKTLIEQAETALYFAQKNGQNANCSYSSDMDIQAKNKLILESDLHKGLQQNQFVLYYQPKFELASETIIGFEALVRWDHPTKGLLLPMDFIPLAEETKLIIPLGEWVIRTACKQIKSWLEMGLPAQNIAVNLSPHQFNQSNFVDQVGDIILDEGISPKHLELEITDTTLLENPEIVASQLEQLCSVGTRISIDDFGTGSSALSNLNIFPLSYLKIEQAFLKDISSEKDACLAQAIITLAKSMDLKTIAEGVETETQKEVLRSLGCDIVQGYLLSKPLPVEEATKLLSAS